MPRQEVADTDGQHLVEQDPHPAEATAVTCCLASSRIAIAFSLVTVGNYTPSRLTSPASLLLHSVECQADDRGVGSCGKAGDKT